MVRLVFLLSATCLFTMTSRFALASAWETSWFDHVAIDGYDVVAYFSKKSLVKGTEKHQLSWQGVQWRFSEPKHLALFKNNPEKYIPQYAGRCAWAAGQPKGGYVASGDPAAWSIKEGKLYFNYNKSVQSDWLKSPKLFIKEGDKNWSQLKNKL